MERHMKFLKSATHGASGFYGQFSSGAVTTSHEAASFFMVMQDKGANADELDAYIRMGQMVDPSKDWKEIKRIARTFTAQTA